MALYPLCTENGLWVARSDLKWLFTPASGPGGQHANRSSTKATLVVRTCDVKGPPELVERLRASYGDSIQVSASEHRSQLRNRAECLERLIAKLESGSTQRNTRKGTIPSAASDRARLEEKKRRSRQKSLRRRPGRCTNDAGDD